MTLTKRTVGHLAGLWMNILFLDQLWELEGIFPTAACCYPITTIFSCLPQGIRTGLWDYQVLLMLCQLKTVAPAIITMNSFTTGSALSASLISRQKGRQHTVNTQFFYAPPPPFFSPLCPNLLFGHTCDILLGMMELLRDKCRQN